MSVMRFRQSLDKPVGVSVAVGDNPGDHLRLGGPLSPGLRWWRLPPLEAGRGIYRGRGMPRPRLGLGQPAVGAVHVGVGPVGHRPVEEVVEPGNANYSFKRMFAKIAQSRTEKAPTRAFSWLKVPTSAYVHVYILWLNACSTYIGP